MELRAFDAYERETQERWRSLPRHQRYAWHILCVLALTVFAVCAYGCTH
ncbi:MAG TPA: hypothetical protein VHD14_16210 [Pseudolabrys sp.]|nr:hypothetical protein [Pseudolabrys sp.]